MQNAAPGEGLLGAALGSEEGALMQNAASVVLQSRESI